MGSQRECTRILGLEGFRVKTIDWEAEGRRAPILIRIERRGIRGFESLAVDDGCGACGIPRSGRGTTCRGPRAA